MLTRKTYRFSWVIGILAMAALACTCGALGQVQGGVQTAQALATQGNQLVTQAQGLATQGVALATQLEQSGLLKTAEAALTEAATSGAFETLGAVGSELPQSEGTGTPNPAVTDVPVTNGIPDDMPIFSQNAQLQLVGSIITYQAQGDLPTLTQFYKTELPKNGWEQAQDPITSSSASILSYKKGDRTATINMISAQTAVTVAIQMKP
jgi:hypothetical protein